MMRTTRPMRSLLALGVIAGVAWPGAAEAHLPTVGLGPVYDGVFHLLLSPEDLIPVIALSLLAGQRGPLFARRALWLLPLAWFAGGMLGLFAGAPRVPSFAWLSFLLMGGLVAADASISARLFAALAVLFGCVHGFLNGSGFNRFDDGIAVVFGLGLTVFVIVALGASLVIPLRLPWTRVAVRVAGSWVAASGLLLLGWTLHGMR